MLGIFRFSFRFIRMYPYATRVLRGTMHSVINENSAMKMSRSGYGKSGCDILRRFDGVDFNISTLDEFITVMKNHDVSEKSGSHCD